MKAKNKKKDIFDLIEANQIFKAKEEIQKNPNLIYQIKDRIPLAGFAARKGKFFLNG